ncbi:T9SS type A sorting domain-containing protein [Paraflavitalea speifideaquila]|uniref:T9SS type A sorting domain-containing protein n=1 Tax=Paraflavitalea speifideaquila TaxID=3076558 RepID=UPI0028E6C120|nr:T9SS type A sorting domain-containing protein [Paraflavitalea speifideiaquila]
MAQDEAVAGIKGLEIYPNPVRNELYIVSGEDLSGGIVQVYDMSGRQVLRGKPVSNRVDVSRLTAGTYTLIYTKDRKSVTKRFVK